MTDAVSSVTSTDLASTMSGATSSVDNPSATMDRDAFLKLLVAQLKYQDPTKPVDATQMVAQSAQLTMVDRLNEIATSLQTAQVGNQLTLASTMVGKEIEFFDDTAARHTAIVETVRIENGTIMLEAGDWSVPLGAVTAVRDAATAAPTTAAPTTDAPTTDAPTTDAPTTAAAEATDAA